MKRGGTIAVSSMAVKSYLQSLMWPVATRSRDHELIDATGVSLTEVAGPVCYLDEIE